MHFTYSEADPQNLMQGDVLQRTDALNDILAEVHPHFYHHPKNAFFMVLTQSCDLVRRHEGTCKAPYITIAPVRSIDVVLERYFQQHDAASIRSDLPVRGQKTQSRAAEFLQRVFNNNEPGFFYLEKEDSVLSQDCAAFLNLSIAIKADLHFQKCLDAKVLQLKDAFQAKLGWLVGQLYSRVGTEDWPSTALTKKVRAALSDAAIWVEDVKLLPLEGKFQQMAALDPNVMLSSEDIQRAVKAMPTKKQEVMAAASKIITEVVKDPGTAELLARRLENDANLTKLLR